MNMNIKVEIIPSRFNMFWHEVVLTCDNKVAKSFGQFRSEEQALQFMDIAMNEYHSIMAHKQVGAQRLSITKH